ncbi:hypothetical protein JCM16138_14900 [Thermococcus atlanticus]
MESFEIRKKTWIYFLVFFIIFMTGNILSAYEKTSLLNAIILGSLVTLAIFGIPGLIVVLFLKRYGLMRGLLLGSVFACLVEFGWAYLLKAFGYEEWKVFATAAILGTIFIAISLGYAIVLLSKQKSSPLKHEDTP